MKTMIKKLKRKFIIINLSLITIVLAITFAAIYISTSRQIIQETAISMQKAIGDMFNKEPPKLEIGKERMDDKDGKFRAAISTFSVQLDENNEILEVYKNNAIVVEDTVLKEMIGSCLKSGNTNGVLSKVDFRYLMQKKFSWNKNSFC